MSATKKNTTNKGKQPAKAADPVATTTDVQDKVAEKTSEAPAGDKIIAKKAAELFKLYPKVEVLYFTSDSVAFFGRNDAVNHGASLKEKSIQEFKR